MKRILIVSIEILSVYKKDRDFYLSLASLITSIAGLYILINLMPVMADFLGVLYEK